MIQINLLPGSGKGRNKGGVPFAAAFASAAGQIKNPYLLVMLVTLLGVGGFVGATWMSQSALADELAARHQAASQDSARYATVIAEKRRAEAQRDSVLRQIEVIKAIDEDRFVWPHILDEVSRHLPPYTWLTSVMQTSSVMSPAAKGIVIDSLKKHADTTKAKNAAEKKNALQAAAAIDSIGKPSPVTFKILGRTVDIQSLTRFMRGMEASPFLKSVKLVKSAAKLEEGSAITEFELEAQFEAPEPGATRRIPLTVLTR